MECKEAFPHEKLVVRALICILVVLRVTYVFTVYLLAGIQHNLNGTEFEVSRVAKVDPMRAVAAFVHPINAVIIGTVNGLRLRRLQYIVHSSTQSCMWYSQIVFTSLLVFGLIGIGAVTIAVNVRLYYIFVAAWYTGAVMQLFVSAIFGKVADLDVPFWLDIVRLCCAIIAAAAGILILATIGWFSLGTSIGDAILTAVTAVYFVTFAHGSDFHCRSRCPNAYPASVPPIASAMKHERTVVRLLLVAFVITVVVLLTVVYLVAGLRDTLTYPNIYISDALVVDPGRAIGAYLIPLLIIAVLIVVTLRLLRIQPLIQEKDKTDKWLFFFACVCVVGTFLGFVGTAAVPLSVNEWVHWVAAVIGFGSGIILMVIMTVMDEKLQIVRPEKLRWTRMGLVSLLVLWGAMACIVFPFSITASAIFEVLSVVTFSIYFVTYGHTSEFPLISAKPQPPQEDPEPIPSTPPI